MKAAVWTEIGHVEVKDVPTPKQGVNEVLL